MMTTSPDFKYSPSQIVEYYNRIGLPSSHKLTSVRNLPSTDQLEHLSLLHKHHCVKFPWENLDQHYTYHRTITIKPTSLFRKVVPSPGRGGYCMENNTLVHFLLHSLGYNTYLGGSRIHSPATGTFGGWTHVVNLVSIAGTKYLIDIGFGARGPITPIPLCRDEAVHAHIAPAQCRVVQQPLPGSLSGQDIWMYQWRTNVQAPWTTQYCFTELEFTLQDVQGLNLVPMTSKTTFFAWKIVCARFTLEGEATEGPGSPEGSVLATGEIDGTLTIEHDVLKWRRHGQKVVELKFNEEHERVAALEKYFGIVLNQDDWEAIGGSAAAVGTRAEVV